MGICLVSEAREQDDILLATRVAAYDNRGRNHVPRHRP